MDTHCCACIEQYVPLSFGKSFFLDDKILQEHISGNEENIKKNKRLHIL